MEERYKYYPNNSYYHRKIKAVIKWTPEFLERIQSSFGLRGEFNSLDVVFSIKNILIISDNAIRLKLHRVYKQGWFTRSRIEGIYYYAFSEKAKRYYSSFGNFQYDGPLAESKKRDRGKR